MAVLQAVSNSVHLPYVSTIHEKLENGTDIYGIELELPILFYGDNPRTLFFWAEPCANPLAAYEQAAQKAIVYLQDIYGFVISDYNYPSFVHYRHLAHILFPLANRGAHLARLVIRGRQNNELFPSHIIECANQLLHDIGSISGNP